MRDPANDREIATGLDQLGRIRTGADLTGGAEAHVAARQVREIAQQRAAAEFFFIRLLERIPERQIEIIDRVLLHQMRSDIAHFGKLETKASRAKDERRSGSRAALQCECRR